MGQLCLENRSAQLSNRTTAVPDIALEFRPVFVQVQPCVLLTCGKSKELSSNSQYSTQQAFKGWKPEDISVYDFPAIVSLVQIIAATLFFHVVPAGKRILF